MEIHHRQHAVLRLLPFYPAWLRLSSTSKRESEVETFQD